MIETHTKKCRFSNHTFCTKLQLKLKIFSSIINNQSLLLIGQTPSKMLKNTITTLNQLLPPLVPYPKSNKSIVSQATLATEKNPQQ